MRHNGIYIAPVSGKGRGVFTATDLAAEVIIEKSPVIILSAKDKKLTDSTLLHDYIFEWQPRGKKLFAMALGWIPLYNHARRSNCEYFMDYDAGEIYVQTVRAIRAGEELCINYHGSWDSEDDVWFEEHREG